MRRESALKALITGFVGFALVATPALARSDSAANGKTVTDQHFLQMAAESDMLHAHLGQMAEKLSTSLGVRDLGLEIRKNCTADYQQLSELAGKTGATIPKDVDAEGDKTIERLSRLRGGEFDRAFIKEVIESDKKAVDAFQQKAEDAQNPDLKTYASTTLPSLKLHLHEAQDWVKYGDDKK
jgi:putative membrane protein